MNYKNFFVYIQQQINRLFQKLRKFVCVYIDDIIMFLHTKVEHKIYFREFFLF